MRKRLTAVLFAAISLAGCGMKPAAVVIPPAPVQKDWTITDTWQYNFTNYVTCSASVTKGCISGFTYGFVINGAAIPTATLAEPISACSVSVTVNCQSGSTQPVTITAQAMQLLGIGPVTPYVVANYVDNAGNVLSSSQDAAAQQSIPAATPTGLLSTQQ